MLHKQQRNSEQKKYSKCDPEVRSCDRITSRGDPTIQRDLGSSHAQVRSWASRSHFGIRLKITQNPTTLTSPNVKFLACLGIYELPVFAIVAVGFKAYLLMAWGVQDQNQSVRRHTACIPKQRTHLSMQDITLVKIADENCPHWDICNPSQALHLAIFLLNLRDHWLPHLLGKVRDVTADVRARWSSDDPKVRHSFDWQMTHQLGEERLRSLQGVMAEQAEQELPERRKVLERKPSQRNTHEAAA